MSQQEVTTRGLTLTNANLQAQRQQGKYQSALSQSAINSMNGENLGNASNTGGNLNQRMSKRNSISSTIDPYPFQNNYLPQQKLENSFRLVPSDNQKFNGARVQRLVKDILENYLVNVKYEPSRCKELVQQLSDEIKNRIKSVIFKRYKLIVNLTIGPNIGNSIIIASRSLWNADTDNCCTVQFKNGSLYAIATIYAAYYD